MDGRAPGLPVIHLVIDQPLGWPFEGDPEIVCGTSHRRRKVDPYPAYPHDELLVREELDRVEAFLPLRHPTTYYLLNYEEISRTNGCSWTDRDYDAPRKIATDDRDGYPLINGTVLSAKRIPPHPAMTRYLVWHEYGHHVEQWLQEARGFRLYGKEVVNEYMELRGYFYKAEKSYGAGTWHATPGEVFANDFRAFVAGVEPEYWPHPGIPRITELRKPTQWMLHGWWEEALGQLRPREDMRSMAMAPTDGKVDEAAA